MAGADAEKDEHGMPNSDSWDSESQSSDDDLNVKSDTDYIHFMNAFSKHPKLQEVFWVLNRKRKTYLVSTNLVNSSICKGRWVSCP